MTGCGSATPILLDGMAVYDARALVTPNKIIMSETLAYALKLTILRAANQTQSTLIKHGYGYIIFEPHTDRPVRKHESDTVQHI